MSHSFSFGVENLNPATKYLLKTYTVVSARDTKMEDGESKIWWAMGRFTKTPNSSLAIQVQCQLRHWAAESSF